MRELTKTDTGMRELTETDIRWMAKGYWDNHFNWRVHPKAKAAVTASAVSVAILGLLVFIDVGLGLDQTPPVIRGLALASLLAFAISLLWAVFTHLKERELFIEAVLGDWETKHELPNRETVKTFTQTGGR